MPQAARVGDSISHTNAYPGLIVGAVAGAVVGAAIVGTGGIAALALGACAGIGLGGIIGEFAAGFTTTITGTIVCGSTDTSTDLLPAARAGDRVVCAWHGGNQFIAEGSGIVAIDRFPAARVGDRTTCDAQIATGSGDAFIGGPSRPILPISSEVPVIADIVVGVAGLVTGVGEIALAEAAARGLMATRLSVGLASGLLGGTVSSAVGGSLFGEGSRGQRQMALAGGLLAGGLGAAMVEGDAVDPFASRSFTSGSDIAPGDVARLAEPKDDIFELSKADTSEGWRTPPDRLPIGAEKYNDLIDMDPQARPLPETYLPRDYIDSHLAQFDEGGSYLVPTKVLDDYGRDALGRPDGVFLSTKADIDQVLAKTGGNIGQIETELGIPPGSWNKPGASLSRIDIPDPRSLDLRLPSGREAGANAEWLPGGLLPTGKAEAVVNQIPQGSYTESVIGP